MSPTDLGSDWRVAEESVTDLVVLDGSPPPGADVLVAVPPGEVFVPLMEELQADEGSSGRAVATATGLTRSCRTWRLHRATPTDQVRAFLRAFDDRSAVDG